MPIFDFECISGDCPKKGIIKELLISNTSLFPDCEDCRSPLLKLVSIPHQFKTDEEGNRKYN